MAAPRHLTRPHTSTDLHQGATQGVEHGAAIAAPFLVLVKYKMRICIVCVCVCVCVCDKLIYNVVTGHATVKEFDAVSNI